MIGASRSPAPRATRSDADSPFRSSKKAGLAARSFGCLDPPDRRFHMAVRRQHVQAAVEVGVEEEHAEGQRAPAWRADAGHDGVVAEQPLAGSCHVEGRHLVGEVADHHRELVVVVEPGRIHAHRARRGAARVEREARFHPGFAEPAFALVQEQEVANRVVGDHEIGAAVAVNVHRRDRQRLAHRLAGGRVGDMHAGILGDVDERPAVVPIKVRVRAGEVGRRAVGATDAGQPVVPPPDRSRATGDVVAREQVEVAVASMSTNAALVLHAPGFRRRRLWR